MGVYQPTNRTLEPQRKDIDVMKMTRMKEQREAQEKADIIFQEELRKADRGHHPQARRRIA